MEPGTPWNRRDFVKSLGVAGGAALGVGELSTDLHADSVEVGEGEAARSDLLPTRRLGKNGPMVSMLAMGGDMNLDSAPRLINRAWSLGYRYFDTAQKYGHGKEESTYRQWFAQNPGRREQLFLVSKDYPRQGPEQLLEMIDRRLAALGTDYLDLYFIHQLCPEVYGKDSVEWPRSDRFRKVAEALKRSGKCRLVGFSCHGGPEYIQAAADGGFLDVVMVQYTPFYERGGIFDRALTACHEKGIGLIAMKTLRHAGNVPRRLPQFEALGLSTHQALLQAVWSDPRITAVCNSVKNLDQMRSSLEAAHRYTRPLDLSLIDHLRNAVLASRRTLCPGCPSCDAQTSTTAFAFRDIARYVTYYEQDGNPEARHLYRSLPAAARDVSTVDLVTLREGCAFGIDYPEIAARAERYFS